MHPSQQNIGAYIKPVVGNIAKAQAAGADSGPAIDRMGYQSATLLGARGATSSNPSAHSVTYKLQHSDTTVNEDFSDVTGVALAALTANDTSARLNIDLSALKRYVRIVATAAFTGGTTPAIPISSTLILGGADKLPAA